TPLDSSEALIDSPHLVNDCKGGGGIVIGQDGPNFVPRDLANNARIINPTIIGTAFSRDNALHGIEIGYVSGGSVSGGRCDTVRYCIVSKGTKECPSFTHMEAVNAGTIAFYQKGGECTIFEDNVAYFLDGDPAFQVAFGVEDDGFDLNWSGPG